jgi:hypothetical protein
VHAASESASGSVGSLPLSFSANTVAGDIILAAFDCDANAGTHSVSDSQGNLFAGVGARLNSPDGVIRCRAFYAKNIQRGGDTETVTLSANSSWIELYPTEYSGIDLTNPIDAQCSASGNAGAVSNGNAARTVAVAVIYQYCVGDWVCTLGAGFTARSNFNSSLIEGEVASTAGSYSATCSATNG